MKKISFLLAFTLSLFFVLFFSACEDEKFPNPDKNKVIVEVIEQNYLALKPSVLNKSSYNNPQNIFLEISAGTTSEANYSWYKKVNGVYQIISLKNKLPRELETNLAYEIIDTLHVSQEAYIINNDHPIIINKPLEMACQNGSVIITKIKNKEMLSQYFWLKTKFTSQDSLLNYNPKTKGFFTSKTKVVSEVKTDLGPIILVLLFVLFTTAIAFRDKVNWLKNIREKIFDSFFSEHFGITKNDHQLNSLILFLMVFIFNSIYFSIWEEGEYGLTIFIAFIFGLAALIMHWPSKLARDNNNFQFTKLTTIFIITGVLALELLLLEVSKVFGAIGLSLVFSPALINLIIELIQYRKYKKCFTKPNVSITK